MREDTLGSMSVDRFLTEIRRTSQLSHAHIVPVLDSGDHFGRPFFVLPFMDGGTLRDRLNRSRQLPFEEVIAIGVTIARALQFAHEHGVIHRDVKPENILFNNGLPCLADFGTSRALEHAANDPTTSTGIVRGTAAYMSPEQASGEREYDGRTDIYSLGCVLYEAVAGMQPFVGPSAQAVITQRIAHEPRPVSVYRPSTPPELQAVLSKATATAPGDRYQSAVEFADALEGLLSVVGNLEAAAAARASKARVRRLQQIVAAVVVIAAVAAGAWMALRPALNANDWMLVADFEAPADDPSLGLAVRELASEAFRQSRFVQIVDRRQLNEVMRRANMPETLPVTSTRARELAVRGAVTAVLQGAVRQMDSVQYEVVMHVVRAEDGTSIASKVRPATLQELPAAVQAIVGELREEIGERRDAIAATTPVRIVSTPSFAAFRKYSQAMDRISHDDDNEGSTALLKDAVALDPEFAAAWVALGNNYLAARQLDSARYAMTRAAAFPDRLTPGRLYKLRGDMAFTFDHDVRAALQWYDRFVAEEPSPSALSTRGFYRTALGRYEESLSDFRAGAIGSPFGASLSQPHLLNYGATLVVVGRIDEARRVLDSLTGMSRDYLAIMIPMAQSRWAAAESAAGSALLAATEPGFTRSNAITSLAAAKGAQGKFVEADNILQQAVVASRGASARWYERARLELALSQGNVPARPSLLAPDTTPAAVMLQALWSAAAGDTSAARRLLERASAKTAAPENAANIVTAWIDIHAGRPVAAAQRLAAAARAGEHDPLSVDRPDNFLLRWTTALAYERAGEPDSAVTFLRMLVEPTHMPPSHVALRGFLVPAAESRIKQLQGRR
jgi:tetratricopeptide (TPR) repeat protein